MAGADSRDAVRQELNVRPVVALSREPRGPGPLATRSSLRYDDFMPTLTAQLHEGELLLQNGPNEDLPPLRLVVDDEGDDLDEEEWERLEAVIAESTAQLARGEHYTADEVLGMLRALRS